MRHDLEVLGLAGAQLLQDEVGHGHAARGVADAGADARKVAAAELVDDGAQAVVAGVAAAHLHAHVARGDIELVVDDEQLLGLDLVLRAELGDGAAARVHVGLGFDQDDLALTAFGLGVVDVDDGDLGARLVLPIADARLLGQDVDRAKAGVVTGCGVFLAGVAESGDHADGLGLCCGHGAPCVRYVPAEYGGGGWMGCQIGARGMWRAAGGVDLGAVCLLAVRYYQFMGVVVRRPI